MNDNTSPPTAGAAAGAHSLAVAASARDWLMRISSAGAREALEAIRDQLAPLIRGEPTPVARSGVIDAVHATLEKAVGMVAANYRGREIPLPATEHDLWRLCIDAQLAVVSAYEALLIEYKCGNESHTTLSGICQVALKHLGDTIVSHMHAHVEVPGELWQRLHQLYRCAEQHPAGVGHDAATSLSTYIRTLLFERAQPYGLTAAQQDHLLGWLATWSRLSALGTGAPSGNTLTTLVVDTDGARGLQLMRHAANGSGVRYLDTQRLGEELKQLSRTLRAGTDMSLPGTVNSLDRSALEQMLTMLYVQWCSAGSGRNSVRAAASAKAMVTLTVPAMHFYISGRAFRQPGQGPTRDENEDLQVFGHVTQRTIQKLASQRSTAFEPWSIDNESSGGLFALCRQPDFRTRIALGQMLGMMRRSDQPLELVIVRRLMLNRDSEIEVGVRRVEGSVRAVAVRATQKRASASGRSPEAAKFERALLLSSGTENPVPARLVLQPGWYARGAIMDLHDGQHALIRLLDLVAHGPNFELARFEIATDHQELAATASAPAFDRSWSPK